MSTNPQGTHWVILVSPRDGETPPKFLSPRRRQGDRYSGFMEREVVGVDEADVWTHPGPAKNALRQAQRKSRPEDLSQAEVIPVRLSVC